MITQLFNSWQTLCKQANTYQLDIGVSEFVCFLTGPPWGRRSCTGNHSHHGHTQQQGSQRNETSTVRVLLWTHSWKEVAAEGHCSWLIKKGQHLNGQTHKATMFSIATGFSSTWPMARTACQQQHTDQNRTGSLRIQTDTHVILADTVRSLWLHRVTN